MKERELCVKGYPQAAVRQSGENLKVVGVGNKSEAVVRDGEERE
jgi:hypothetical protein